ncbi:MAG: glycosyltransferase family 2 protein [Pseudomonadota bacterium]
MTQPTAPTKRRDDPLISLVVPCFNEEHAIPIFMEAVNRALRDVRLEIIFVNDGSIDATLPVLIALSLEDDRVVVTNLSRNFGKEAALSAGVDLANGDVVVPIDCDLQDPPALVVTFIERWRDGYDVVYGIRSNRSNDSKTKRVTARIFYRLFNRLSYTDIPSNVGDFRLMDRVVIDAVKQMPERNRFMKGIFAWVGFTSIGVPYTRQIRPVGASKFSYWRLWNFALDGLVSFSTIPLRVWTYTGTLIAVSSVMYAIVIVIRTLVLGRDVPGYASIMTAVLFLGGVQLISLGVIGEYLSRLFTESKQRPIYIVNGIYRDGKQADAD